MDLSFGLSFTARNVLIGATLLGALGGMLGSFALLRRQSLLGDALAHAALPGVCLGFLLTGSKSPLPLFTGALAAGLLGALLILATVRWSRIKEDSAIGIILYIGWFFIRTPLTEPLLTIGGEEGNWTNNIEALTVPFMASAFSIFMLRQFFMQVPNELWDAARIDGCGHLRFWPISSLLQWESGCLST